MMIRAGWCALLIAACGGGSNGDDTTTTPGTDAPTTSAQPIVVNVTDATKPTAMPAVNATVIIGDTTTTTNTSGVATAQASGPTPVTVVQATASQVFIETVLGAMPGDALSLGAPMPGQADAGQFTVSFAPVSGATDYTVFGPCGQTSQNGSPIALRMSSNCEHDPLDLLMLPTGDSDLGVATYAAAQYTRNGGAALPPPSHYVPFSVVLDNVPGGLLSLDMSTDVVVAHNGAHLDNPPAGSLTMSDQDLLTPVTNFALSALTPSGESQLVLVRGNMHQDITLDLGAALLPWLASPTYVASEHAVTIQAGAGGNADLYELTLDYKNAAGTAIEWRIYAAEPQNVQLIDIPASAVDALPAGGVQIMAMLLKVDGVGGYAAAHLHPDAIQPALTRGGTEQQVVFSLASGH